MTDRPKTTLEPKNTQKRLVVLAVVVTVAIAVGLFLLRERFGFLRGQITAKDGASASVLGLRSDLPPLEMTVPTQKLQVALQASFRDAASAERVYDENEWLKQAVNSPLGDGFLGNWRGFAGTKGDDLHASFKETIAKRMIETVLNQPFSWVWFGGEASPGQGALIVNDASGTAKTTVGALNVAASRGLLTATHCPGDSAPPEAAPVQDEGTDEKAKKEAAKKRAEKAKYKIVRWLIADRSLYVGQEGEKLVFSSHPLGVLHGLCASVKTQLSEGEWSNIALTPAGFGREAQMLAHMVGVEERVHFGLGLEGGRLIPRGISGALKGANRLAVSGFSESLYKLVPADFPVTALLHLSLPTDLSESALASFFKGEAIAQALTRQVALLWDPRGNTLEATEVALVWSRGEDETRLREIFSGPNASRLHWAKVCDHLVTASSETLLGKLEASCAGKRPSRLNAAPEVVTGAKQPTSVGLQVHFGTLLSQLLVDAYRSDKTDHKTASLPSEIEAARKQLEALPLFGFAGRAEGQADKASLRPQGFRS